MKEKYEFCDDMLIGNIKALARIPLSYHEKSGLQIIPVDYKLNPTKIRGLSYYTEFGLKTEDIKNKYIEAKVIAEERKKEIAKDIASYNAKKARGEIKDGEIRPCFKQRLEKGEMPHGMRLACLVEGFHSGIGSIDNQEPLVQLFSTLHDYDGYKLSKETSVTRYQVWWFFDQQNYKYPPYKCETLLEKKYCLGEECPIYNKIFKK
jgi:hypothetical protein